MTVEEFADAGGEILAIRIYGLTTCDTCRKAEKALRDKGLEVERIDVRKTPLAEDVLRRFAAAFDDNVINRKSTTWRALPEDERKKEAVALMSAHPAVMKRPVIEVDGTLYLGWGRDVQAKLGLA